LTTITPITGNITTTDNRSASDVVYLVSAVYTTANSDALNITAGTNVEIDFRHGGSVFNTFGVGFAIYSNTDIFLGVEEGSTLSSGGTAIGMQGNALILRNFGSIVGEAAAIALAGNGSIIENYGEIRGKTAAYTSLNAAVSTIDNFGTFRADGAFAFALSLGDLGDTFNNYGTVFGTASLAGGTDTVFNSGTMRGYTGIAASSGDKAIVNSGLIAATSVGYAIDLRGGNDTVTNLGQILGDVWLGDGNNKFVGGGNGSVASGSVLSGGGTDNLSGAASADRFLAGSGNDSLIGGGGDDYLDGQAGADYMQGDTGSDTYIVNELRDVVVELVGQGVDTVGTFISYALGTGVEVEFLASATASDVTLVGNEFAQTISGGTGDDTLDGGVGADVLEGGLGEDVYVLGAGSDTVIDSAGNDTITSTITRSLASYAAIENLTLLGAAAVNGTGNALNNDITGNAAANVLDGGMGRDFMVGFAGNDTYVVDNANDVVNEGIGVAGGTDTVLSSLSFSLVEASGPEATVLGAFENLTLTGTALINGTGNAFNNLIIGNAAANVLDGGAGADTLRGFGGNDTYVLAAGSDVVTEIAGAPGGIDTATSTLTRSLAIGGLVNVENLALLGTAAINGTGNALANTITGNTAANTLDGGLGNDKLLGLAGNDVLVGSLGKDTSTGGAGNDVFRFAAKTHSLVGANADVVTDFDDSGNDRIDVSALFGPAMAYRHNLAFTAAGQLRINDIAGADVIVEVNTSGSLAADFAVRLTSTTLASMSAADFFL
jgi:Ca2+-binding RTX toxin-like protein